MESAKNLAVIEVLTSPGCTHCHTFLEFWNKEGSRWPNVTMKETSLLTPEGQAMVGKYHIFASPGIIINDELFETGNFDKKKLIAKLEALSQ